MKSALLLIFALLFALLSHGQNVTFDSLHFWKGNIFDFDWKLNEVSVNQNLSASSLIYFEANWKEDVEFSCEVSLPFSPSNNNVFELLISTDSLFSVSNLISLRIGESGVLDGLDIFQGNDLKISNPNRNWGSGGTAIISIHYKKDSLMFFEKFEKDTIKRVGVLYLPNALNYIGLNCKYTKSNATKFRFNNLYFGVQPIDSIPPCIVSTDITGKNEIELFF